MILPGQEIRKRTGMITPFKEKYKFNGVSGGLSVASYDVALDQNLFIPPRGFVLASTMECFNMPFDVGALNLDKSTWARKGLSVQNTWTDPGFKGYLTLEINSNVDEEFAIQAGTPICQVIFIKMASVVENPYDGKYQNQQRGPQQAK